VPIDLADALARKCKPGRFVLVDCLTVWIGNLMHHRLDVIPELAKLADAVRMATGNVVLVSNEVGQGIVPENAMARAFRDHQGRCNQMMAAACDEVVLVVAGIPMMIKSPAR
jgi:adenosylcobinamide kinase / adenosylcobinamide-phosphate guanylyltransferase